MKRNAIALGSLCVLAALGVGAWLSANGKSDPAVQPSKALPVLSVSVVAPRQQVVDDEIRVTGTVVPRENVVVASELAGLRVRSIHAETGDRVKKGQLLAVLDSEGLSIDSQGLQAEFDRTRDEYERVTSLLADGIVTRESVRQRQAAFESARSRLRSAQLNISRAQIVAPTDGLIYERSATIGGLANGGEPLFRIAKAGKVEMEASVPESLAARLKPGMKVTIRIAGEPEPLTGSVRLVVPLVDNARRVIAVRVRFDRDRNAPVGVFCEASVVVDQVSGWVVPGTALQQDEQGTFVWQLSPGSTVLRKPATVVMRAAGEVVLQEPLAEGGPVVARAGAFLNEGDLVAVVKEQRP